ncbi:MAG: metal-dependent hydrolase [Oligoflexus sp.]
MDPIAHTLTGATLSQTGLKKLTPLATATLVIAANLPDIDAVMTFVGRDASLYYRRGITHGIAALLLLPLVLTGIILAIDRLIRRARHPKKEPARARGLLLLSYIGVWSHPFLDWLNTYGVRLLMPFDGRWFYGDTLFIVDAWMWLLMGAAVIFAHTQTKLGMMLWIALGSGMSFLITTVDMVSLPAKIVWWIGVAIIVAFRLRGVKPDKNQKVAVACVVTFCLYLATLTAGNQTARQGVEEWLAKENSSVVTDLMTGPMPANPFYRDVIAVTNTHYHGLRVRVLGSFEVERLFEPVKIEEPHPIVELAMQAKEVRGFTNWMRFPSYEIRPEGDGYLVLIRDLRYVRPDQEDDAGIGMAKVFVSAEEVESLTF